MQGPTQEQNQADKDVINGGKNQGDIDTDLPNPDCHTELYRLLR